VTTETNTVTVPEPRPRGRTAALVDACHRAIIDQGRLLSAGDVASLKRMDARQPAPAFYKLVGCVLNESLRATGDAHETEMAHWAVIVGGLALLGDRHRARGPNLGVALARAGYSEKRFAQLLSAPEQDLRVLLGRVAKLLTSAGIQVDWANAARFLLSCGRPNHEKVRREIAIGYYSTSTRNKED